MSNGKLAIEGGTPAVRSLGPYPSKVGLDELLELLSLWEMSPSTEKAVVDLLRAEKGLKGPHLFRYYNPRPSKVEEAEKLMRSAIGVSHCLAVNSCTSALVASYRALGIGAGDEVIVPAYTFFATASTVCACNAVPVIVDIDDTLTMDPAAVEKSITKRTKAIVVVHMRGAPARMDALMDVARRHGIPVVEDVAQACGGSFQGRPLGSIGAIGCFSFDYYKIAVSGEGGFVTTNDEWLHTRAQSWHDTAACWRPERFARERREGELFGGENYRMSEMEGAVAVAQLRKLSTVLAGSRRAQARILAGIERRAGLTFRAITDSVGDTGINLIFFLPDADRARRAAEALKAEGVPAGGIYDSKVRDWHVFKYWDHVLERKSVAADRLPWSAIPEAELPKYSRDMCPRTLDYLARAVILDIDWHFSEPDCDAIADGINKVLRALLA
jgi:8-amino-3,8-dideoxy-alpha-D-manno-octulosonate transaminase